jgi:hypothetical protein
MSYGEQLRKIIREYEQSVTTEPTSLDEIAQWAIKEGKWVARPRDIVKICRDELADAAREDVFVDDTGREVRLRHSLRVSEGGAQYTLWGNMHLSPESFLSKSFSQRRRQVGRDCFKLKQDVDHFNEKRDPELPFGLILDFSEDVAEMEAANKASDRDEEKTGT